MKIISVGIVFLMYLGIVSATYTCEETCEIELPDCYDGVCSAMEEGDERDACFVNCDNIYDICIDDCCSLDCLEEANDCVTLSCEGDYIWWGSGEPPYSDCTDICYVPFQYCMNYGCGIDNPAFVFDSDGDGVLDLYEDSDESGLLHDDNTDGDGLYDYVDADDDGDGIPTADENPDPNGDGNPSDAWDSDDDGIPDYLDSVEEEEVIAEEEPECTSDSDCHVGYECLDGGCILIDDEDLVDVPIPVPIPPCHETDAGRDYISQGTILSGVTREDKCITGDRLRERYCSTETTYTSEDIICSEVYGGGWGCDEGECVELEEVSGFPWWILLLIALIYYYNKNKKKSKRKNKKRRLR